MGFFHVLVDILVSASMESLHHQMMRMLRNHAQFAGDDITTNTNNFHFKEPSKFTSLSNDAQIYPSDTNFIIKSLGPLSPGMYDTRLQIHMLQFST